MDPSKFGLGAPALCAAATLVLAGCAPQDGGAAGDGTVVVASPTPPAALVSGRDLFDAHCAECHGSAASGTTQGPPLVHDIYRPGHHADASFHLAVQRGSRAHHWNFGDMQPLPEVPAARVQEIVGYVRWLQREAGVR